MKTEPVSGIVTLDDIPLADALVGFVPKEGGGAPAYGKSDVEGKYTIQTARGAAEAGTLPGEYSITVSCTELVPGGRKQTNPETGQQEDVMDPKETLPSVYQNSSKTPLSYTVVPGRNTYDIKLSKTP